MRILIIHYHLHKGGVTDLIQKALSALLPLENTTRKHPTSIFENKHKINTKNQKISIVLASGECVPSVSSINQSILNNSNITVHIEPALSYLDNIKETMNKTDIETNLEKFFTLYNDKQTLWWVHNHHLGKNPVFTHSLIQYINDYKIPCILQIHDFPEAARYQNMTNLQAEMPIEMTYQNTIHSIFAVINSHDKTLLKNSGIDAHLLPNIVSNNIPTTNINSHKKNTTELKSLLAKTFSQYIPLATQHTDYQLFTYPVRCIRRKNVIEAGLITQLYEHYFNIPSLFCVTLSGNSKQEKSYSELVQSLFEKFIFHGYFNIGNFLDNHHINFNDVCASSDLIISSSTQEGFGFSFLNSVHWKVPLMAREITVTPDINLVLKDTWPCYWYQQVHIPHTLFSSKQKKELKTQYKKKLAYINQFYPLEFMPDITKQIETFLKNESIDFSFLPVSLQYAIVQKIHKDSSVADEISFANKPLLKQMHSCITNKLSIHIDTMHKNTTDKINKFYGEEMFRNKFMTLCEITMSGKATATSNGIYSAKNIQKEFLNIDNLRVLYNLF